jgi:putative phage-type endonuclease
MITEERKKWLLERKTYIGGSDIAACCGLSPYKTPLRVYLEKTSPEIKETTNEAMERGHRLEPEVARMYEENTGFELEIEPNVIRHPDYSFMAVNIDRWADNKKHLLEIKTTDSMSGAIRRKEWGEQYTDQVPEVYLCQVAYQSAIVSASQPISHVDIALLIGEREFRIYTYKPDKELEDKLLQVAFNFWHNHILKQIPPEPIGLEDISSLYKEGNGQSIEADGLIMEKVSILRGLKAQEREITEAIRQVQAEVQSFMKENEVLIDNCGNTLATWKTLKPKVVFDINALQEENGELMNRYIKESKQSRMFLIK